ncbi:MAG: hypothetical protein MPW15_19470 [Candidatus Manganitrophus sp.]|nr:hypothetical protein [Candidatus Manganitrophus sp.]
MQIKKYEVFEIAEALQAIKKEMGPDAVILSTREIQKGDFGLLGRPMIEVTAAVDPPSPMQQQRERRQTEERSEPVRGETSRRDVSTGESKGFGDLLEAAGRAAGGRSGHRIGLGRASGGQGVDGGPSEIEPGDERGAIGDEKPIPISPFRNPQSAIRNRMIFIRPWRPFSGGWS